MEEEDKYHSLSKTSYIIVSPELNSLKIGKFGLIDFRLEVGQVMSAELPGHMKIITPKFVVKSAGLAIRGTCRPFIPNFPLIVTELISKELADLVLHVDSQISQVYQII